MSVCLNTKKSYCFCFLDFNQVSRVAEDEAELQEMRASLSKVVELDLSCTRFIC